MIDLSRSVGEVAGLATAVCWTASAVALSAASRRIGSLPVNLIRIAQAALLLTLYGAIVRGLAWPADAGRHQWFWLSASGIVGFTLGDLCLFKAYVLIGAVLSKHGMAMTGPLAPAAGLMYDPVASTQILPFAAFVQRERVSLRAAGGAILAVAGVALLFGADST